MSASTERKNRQAAREAGTDKKMLALEKEAKEKAKSKRRWTIGTVAVVGMGDIGRKFAARARALGAFSISSTICPSLRKLTARSGRSVDAAWGSSAKG